MAALALDALKLKLAKLLEARDYLPTCVTAHAVSGEYSTLLTWGQYDNGKNTEYNVSLTFNEALQATGVPAAVAAVIHSALSSVGAGKVQVGHVTHDAGNVFPKLEAVFTANYGAAAVSLDALTKALQEHLAVHVVLCGNGTDILGPDDFSHELTLAVAKASLPGNLFKPDLSTFDVNLTLPNVEADDHGSTRIEHETVSMHMAPGRIEVKKQVTA